MDFSEITKRLPQPSMPKEAEELDWDTVERDLSVELPTSYKQFISTYGTGSIGEFLWVFNPSSANHSLNGQAIRYFQSSYEILQQDFPNDYTRPVFPSEKSFLPWAVSDNGDTLVWIVDSGPSDSWCVGIMGSDQVEEEIFEFGFVEFIVQLLDRKIASSILPEQFLQLDKEFQSVV